MATKTIPNVIPHTAIALNREFVDREIRLNEGDEVAFFPPVSGGSGTSPDVDKFAVTFDPIRLDDIAARIVKPETGAVALFAGVVRNVSGGKTVEHLEYEVYTDTNNE
ncbi:MAG: MoaD/ThiS family protein [Anaerolineae bacterium]|nr:MoaD/ThiS family protein [Anaerolineae bacterium]